MEPACGCAGIVGQIVIQLYHLNCYVMKNKITGKLATALFVAPIFLFSLLIVSCGQGDGQTEAPSSTALKSSSGSAAKAALTCTDVTCPTVTFAVKYDSTRGPGPKLYVFEATTGSAIAAGTHLRLEVSMPADTVSH